ncbi:MAG TPA: radical SAM protein [Nitrospirae bacterium]|nr:radical SAM protein [Nitrospirota bacterium]
MNDNQRNSAKGSVRVPKRFQIETIYSCNASCGMCALSLPPTRKKGPMSMGVFKAIVDVMAPFSGEIEKVDLFGLGEPLLDPHIFDRIAYMKKRGFTNLAISTNADLLNEDKRERLLYTGVETVIFSVDGVSKRTHESIRPGVTFERVVGNCAAAIKLRDDSSYPTRFVIRFIRQESNLDEWEGFKEYWAPKLSFDKGDLIIAYDMNTMGGEVSSKENLVSDKIDRDIEKAPCNQVFERLIVLSDGTVPLCCEDTPKFKYAQGSALETPPIDIFNSTGFENIRRLHLDGEKNRIPLCAQCTVLYSEGGVEIIDAYTTRNIV